MPVTLPAFPAHSLHSQLSSVLASRGQSHPRAPIPFNCRHPSLYPTSADLSRDEQFPINSPQPFMFQGWLCLSSPSPARAVQDPLSCPCQPLITQHWKSKAQPRWSQASSRQLQPNKPTKNPFHIPWGIHKWILVNAVNGNSSPAVNLSSNLSDPSFSSGNQRPERSSYCPFSDCFKNIYNIFFFIQRISEFTQNELAVTENITVCTDSFPITHFTTLLRAWNIN